MSNASIQQDLVFDLGVHKGYDTEFYLKKGFRVVGLEAVPELHRQAVKKVRSFGDRATLINRALYDQANRSVSFYMVPNKDDWGSLDRGLAEKGVEEAVEIVVDTIDLATMFDSYGTPYYLKCDLEGGDMIFRKQLLADTRRPTFVSIEMNDGQENEILKECGYELGQIVNQWMHGFKRPPNPPLEGKYYDTAITGEMSGLFGRELNPNKWRPLEEIADIYHRWFALRMTDEELAPGWVDLHVCRRDALA